MRKGTRQLLSRYWVIHVMQMATSLQHYLIRRLRNARHSWIILHWILVKFRPMLTMVVVAVSFLLTASSTISIRNCTLLDLSSTPQKLSQSLIMVTRVLYAYLINLFFRFLFSNLLRRGLGKLWKWILLFGIDFIGGRRLQPLPFERFVISFVLLISWGHVSMLLF